MTSKFPRSQSDQASRMCWNNKRNPSRPHLQLTGLQGSTAHVLVPDTKGHLLGSCGVQTCFGGTSGTYTILGGFNVVAVTVCMYVCTVYAQCRLFVSVRYFEFVSHFTYNVCFCLDRYSLAGMQLMCQHSVFESSDCQYFLCMTSELSLLDLLNLNFS